MEKEEYIQKLEGLICRQDKIINEYKTIVVRLKDMLEGKEPSCKHEQDGVSYNDKGEYRCMKCRQ